MSDITPEELADIERRAKVAGNIRPQRALALVAEVRRLRAIIARALHELDPPAFYGEGSVWNDMLETLPDPTGGSKGHD